MRARLRLARRALHFLHHFVLFALVNGVPVPVNGHPAVHAIEQIADRIAAAHLQATLAPGHQSPGFEHELPIAVVIRAGLGVRSLLVIIVLKFAAGAAHRLQAHVGVRQPQTPTSDVHFVNALVAHIAVAGIPKPMPVVSKTQLVEGPQRGRAQEQVPIHSRRRRLISPLSNRLAALVAQALGEINLAQHAVLQQLHRLHLVRHAARLAADLAHTRILPRRRNHLLALERVMAGWLLAISVLAGLHRPNCGQGVPMVRRRDRDGVDVFVFEHLSHIAVLFGFGSLFTRDRRLRLLQRRLIHVAQARDVSAGQLQIFAQMVATATA